MKKIIRKILKEDRRQEYLNKIIKFIKNDFPLFNNMKLYDFYEQLSEEELNYVFSGIFGEPVEKYSMGLYNENGDIIYWEESDNYWEKWEYDENGYFIYSEHDNGDWEKTEYDKNDNIIYYEDSDGYWEKREYDENTNEIYYENSSGEIRDNR